HRVRLGRLRVQPGSRPRPERRRPAADRHRRHQPGRAFQRRGSLRRRQAIGVGPRRSQRRPRGIPVHPLRQHFPPHHPLTPGRRARTATSEERPPMLISVVKEIKPAEQRVAITPSGVAALFSQGHTVHVEFGAGANAGFSDEQYAAAGAILVGQAEAWASAELLVKVKEPIASEYQFLRDDLALFTYLHLAADRPLTEALLQAGTLSIA